MATMDTEGRQALLRHLLWRQRAGLREVVVPSAQGVAGRRPEGESSGNEAGDSRPPSSPSLVPREGPPAAAGPADASTRRGRGSAAPGAAPTVATPLPTQGASEAKETGNSQVGSGPLGYRHGAGSPALKLIRETLGDCVRCGLCKGRTNLVFGVGDPDAQVVFVGEGPGANEDREGEPFVGRAGALLDKMIQAMGLARESVYICNVVKCRPPSNRDPEPKEVEACSEFLKAQLAVIAPKIVVGLGRFAVQTLLGDPKARITRVRGQWGSYESVPMMPTFHPAYLLRNPAAKREVWADLQAVMAKLSEESGS